MAEVFYRRGDKSTETVVLLLPDTTALLPSRVDWEKQQATYRQALQAKLNPAAAAAAAAAQDEKARPRRAVDGRGAAGVCSCSLSCVAGSWERPGAAADRAGTDPRPNGR